MGHGPEFFQTVMGHQFYDGTMPKIAKALERIAAALEQSNAPKNDLLTALVRITNQAEMMQADGNGHSLVKDCIPAARAAIQKATIKRKETA